MDLSCVQLTPYKVGDTVLLLSQVLIPLPESKDYEARSTVKRQVSQQRKSSKRLTADQRARIRDFIAAIPDGRWTSYKEVGLAATGNPLAGMGIGSHLSSRWAEDYPKVYRVLRSDGAVSGGWKAVDRDLPATPQEVRARLEGEGVPFEGDRAAERALFTAAEWEASRPSPAVG